MNTPLELAGSWMKAAVVDCNRKQTEMGRFTRVLTEKVTLGRPVPTAKGSS